MKIIILVSIKRVIDTGIVILITLIKVLQVGTYTIASLVYLHPTHVIQGGPSLTDMVYVYVPAFWGAFLRNLV